MKTCVGCGASKPEDGFARDRQKRDGRRPRCKACEHDSYTRQQHHGVTVATKRCGACGESKQAGEFSRRSVSGDGLAAQCKGCHREYFKAWWLEHGEAQNVKLRPYYRRYYVENRLVWKVYKLRRRDRGAREISRRLAETILAEQRGKCAGCGGDLNGSFHLDHVVPLSRGGSSARENLQALHPRCNLSKGSKLPSEWTPPSAASM